MGGRDERQHGIFYFFRVLVGGRVDDDLILSFSGGMRGVWLVIPILRVLVVLSNF